MQKQVRKRRLRRIEQFKNVCKKITTFMFSRVGLCFVLVGYVIIGGFIFQSIEGRHEEEKARNKTLVSDLVKRDTEDLVNAIWNMTKYELVFHKKNYTNKLKEKLIVFQKNLTEAMKDGYKGNTNHSIIKWTFPGSVVYSVTIVTSIGYGHITCDTDAGKIATIFYALFGMPMMILCLANIGSSMANLFRFLYARVCCGYCNYVKKRNLRMKTAATLAITANVAAGVSGVNPISKYPPNYSFNINESSFNEVQNQQPSNLNQYQSYNYQNDDKNNKYYGNDINRRQSNQSQIRKSSMGPNDGENINETEIYEYYDESMSASEHKKVTVPISVTLFILLSYVIFGGVFFKTLEGWSLLDSVYFCFITLTTIGLGDFVPGNSINDSDTKAELKLFGCSLYLLMGLSLISMCFSLMQEEVSAKSRKLGKSI